MATPKPDEAAIFDAARRIKVPEDRRLYLEQVSSKDRNLRVRIEALLRVHDEEPGFLEPPTQERDASLAPLARQRQGVRIGQYSLLEQIGEGGMGTVYLAEQHHPMQRKVALKIIKRGLGSGQVIARFEAERQTLALMDHPNIAKVLDAGNAVEVSAAAGTGTPYFVMEWVRGVPITAYCDAHRLTPHERLRLFLPVCHAVQHAHQKGIIHRDLKPPNVLVTQYDGQPVPKVIDFGIAKATRRELNERTLHTELGAIIGTLEYMSPEQAELGQSDIDTRSDIYSLGVVLYELLTGTTPLQAKWLSGAVLLDLLRLVRDEESLPPSTRLATSEELPAIAVNRGFEPKRLCGLVRGDLDWIVMKCLEKDRTRRYETANALARDLERYLNEEPVEAGPPSVGYRLRKFARKHRKLLAAAAVFALLLAAGIVVSTWQALRATLAEQATSRERDKAVAEKARADEQAAVAEAVNRFFNYDLLLQASPEVTPDRDLTLRTVLDRASRKIERGFESQPLVEARIRTTLAVTYQSLGEYAAAERHGLRARDLYRDALGPEHLQTLAAMNNLAVVFTLQGKFEEARRLHEESLQTRRRVHGPEHPRTLGEMNNLAELLVRQDRLEEARQLHEENLQLRRRILGPEDSETLQSMMNLAGALRAQGQWEEARKLLVQTLELNHRLRPPEYAARASIMGDLAQVLTMIGREDEARRMYEDGLQLSRRVNGAKHPDTLLTMNNFAWLLATAVAPQLRDPPRAVKLAKEITAVAPEKGDAWNTLGVAYYRACNWQAAILALEESERLAPGQYVGHNGFFLAMAHWRLGAQEKARQWFQKAAAWMDKNQPSDPKLLRFRTEASKLLGLPDTQAPVTMPSQ
jgi:serine/threonine protein kinase/Flp pilus assembly protein TadD